jgi:hypothetical protein
MSSSFSLSCDDFLTTLLSYINFRYIIASVLFRPRLHSSLLDYFLSHCVISLIFMCIFTFFFLKRGLTLKQNINNDNKQKLWFFNLVILSFSNTILYILFLSSSSCESIQN